MAIINDLVLVYVEDKPGFYARIEDISPDVKKGWWTVRLLVLTFPMQVYTWILDETQIDGASFTMGGTPLRIEKVESPVHIEEEKKQKKMNPNPSPGSVDTGRPKVVSLLDRKKNS